MAKKHRTHLVFPILPSELKTLQLGNLPEPLEVGGLIFTRYETEQALRRWQQMKLQHPLKHPSRSAYIQQSLEMQGRTDVALKKMRVAYEKVQEEIEVAKTEILCKITEKSDLQRDLQHEIQLRQNAERQQKISDDLVTAHKRKLAAAEQQNVLLRKTIERYEIRYQTLRNEYPLNWFQRFIGWVFRIC